MKFFAMFMCILQSQGEQCSVGWFGSQCSSQCHCKSNLCTESGECGVNNTCQTGWFGPQCQYIDLISNKSSTNYSWLNDGDGETCNDGNLTKGGLSITTDVEFTWARIVVKDPEYLYDITVQFQDETPCMGMKSFTVNDRIRDVVCLNYTTVTSVILKGKGLRSLCSFYISGGRNVALKQYANMSSIFAFASNAVDGDLNEIYYSRFGKCAHTGKFDPKPILLIFFGSYVQINRVIIYNRANPFGNYFLLNRTLGFILTLLDGGDIISQYQDGTGTGQKIYNIRFREKRPVQAISIEATNIMRGEIYINICEVEVYGEIVCPIGKYGIRCEESCDNCKNKDCFVSTGECLNGCAPGKVPTDCDRNTACAVSKYGWDCQYFCFVNENECFSGCPPGNLPTNSDQNCLSAQYGPYCVDKCPQNCRKQKCDKLLGICRQGCVAGYVGKYCESGCDSGFYGPNCTLKCPGKCLNGACLPDTGLCALGCQEGYQAPACTKKKSDDLKNGINQLISILIALSSAIIIFTVIFCCCREKVEPAEE